MSDWTDTIDGLIDYLRFQQENGGRLVSLDPAVLEDITTVINVAHAPAVAQGVPAATHAKLPPEVLCDSPEQRQAALDQIAAKAAACDLCPLATSRTRVVPGQGNPNSPEILFVAEAPGHDEDLQGVAFAGAAGELLTKMIAAMGFAREEVFISYVCKCKPQRSQPTIAEMQACLPFLQAQIAIIKPKVIVTLGATAAIGLLKTQTGLAKLRGNWTRYNGIPLMPTFHPAYLLRFPPAKRDAWNDLKSVLEKLGRSVPIPAQKIK